MLTMLPEAPSLKIDIPGRTPAAAHAHAPAAGSAPERRHSHRVSPDGKLILGPLLASGGQGQVFQARVLDSRQKIAVKIISRDNPLERLSGHPGVMGLLPGLPVQTTTHHVWLPMELFDRDLLQVLQRRGGLPEVVAQTIFAQVVAAVAHCHREHVYHLDIKPENILLKGRRAVLADFGSACISEMQPPVCSHISSSAVSCPPEVYRMAQGEGCDLSYDPEKADVWSLGVLLYMMVTGQPPWAEPTKSDSRFSRLVYRQFVMPSSVPATILDLLNGMLTVDASHRMSMAHVTSHPWVATAVVPRVDIPADEARDTESVDSGSPASLRGPAMDSPVSSSEYSTAQEDAALTVPMAACSLADRPPRAGSPVRLTNLGLIESLRSAKLSEEDSPSSWSRQSSTPSPSRSARVTLVPHIHVQQFDSSPTKRSRARVPVKDFPSPVAHRRRLSEEDIAETNTPSSVASLP